MTPERLEGLLAGEPAYRLRQASRAVFAEGASSFAEVATLPAGLRERLRSVAVLCLSPEEVKVSGDAQARKASLRLADGKRIETVLLEPRPGSRTVCVSTQAGCALGCSFCATGLMGFERDLTDEEITDQVLFWRQLLRREQAGRIANVVYMGMGEPFLNLKNVFASLRRLTDPGLFGIGDRRISVSTAGVVGGLEAIAREFPQVNLALSLHAATHELRRRLVPLEKAYPLRRLSRALRDYFKALRRKVFLEVVLLRGENDRPEDAEALARFVRCSGPRGLLHVNLIAWNPAGTPHAPSRPEAVRRFAGVLRAAGVPVTFRRSLGADIAGACGQLAAR